MKLFVDDVRDPPDQPKWYQFWLPRWKVARTYDKAIQILSTGKVKKLSLDHDLGPGKTGYDIAKFLEERAYNKSRVPSDIRVHSANPVGRRNIQRAIKCIKMFESNL